MKPSQSTPSQRNARTPPTALPWPPSRDRTNRRVPSDATAHACVSPGGAKEGGGAEGLAELGPLVVVSAVDLVHARELLDLEPRDLPRALYHPGERPVEPGRLFLDFLQHRLGEVETLLPLVGLRDLATRGR